MSIRRPSHLKEDLVLAFLTVIAMTSVMALWRITVRDYSTQAIKLVSAREFLAWAIDERNTL